MLIPELSPVQLHTLTVKMAQKSRSRQRLCPTTSSLKQLCIPPRYSKADGWFEQEHALVPETLLAEMSMSTIETTAGSYGDKCSYLAITIPEITVHTTEIVRCEQLVLSKICAHTWNIVRRIAYTCHRGR